MFDSPLIGPYHRPWEIISVPLKLMADYRGSLGSNLRRAREEGGISLEEISQKTKISTRFLQAIENEQFDRLPGGLFSRSFVLQYARELGMDDMTVKEYLQASAEQVEAPAFLSSDTSGQSSSTGADYARIILAALGIGLLLAGVSYGGYLLYDFVTADQLFAEARTGEPSATVPTEPSAAVPNDEAMAVPGRVEQDSGLEGMAVASAAAATAVENEEPIVPASPQQGELELQIASHGPAWLSITADGVREWQGTMQANQTRDVQAAESINLTVGDAGAVSLTLNGNPMPELGPAGQVRSLTITAAEAAEISP